MHLYMYRCVQLILVHITHHPKVTHTYSELDTICQAGLEILEARLQLFDAGFKYLINISRRLRLVEDWLQALEAGFKWFSNM